MIRDLFWLACMALFACSTPSETPTEKQQSGLENSVQEAIPLTPDTAGLSRACLDFLKKNTCPHCPGPRELPLSYQHLLVLTGDASGMIPASAHLDDSTGFKALFFRRQNGRFQFYCAWEGEAAGFR